MINGTINEILQNLIYLTCLWCQYHKRLIETYMNVLENVLKLKEYIQIHITEKNVYTYEENQSLEYILLIVSLIYNGTECMIKYEKRVFNYISTITNNINQIPPNITGVTFVWKPEKNNFLYKILEECHEINKLILNLSNICTYIL